MKLELSTDELEIISDALFFTGGHNKIPSDQLIPVARKVDDLLREAVLRELDEEEELKYTEEI